MKHAITITRRLDLSGAPWAIEVNGVRMGHMLIDALPIKQQHVDEAIQHFDEMMNQDDAALTKVERTA